MAESHMLTTIDNPYNPFTQWDDWYVYDMHAGYYTSEFLARITKTSDELSEADEDLAIEDAIDDIVKLNPSGLYRKVVATDNMQEQAAAAIAILAQLDSA